MARRKKVSIRIQDLSKSLQELLLQDLKGKDQFNDVNLSTIVIVGTQKLIEVSKNINRAFSDLRKYMKSKSDDELYVYGKTGLCKVLKISRPTLDKWIQEGIIKHHDGLEHNVVNLKYVAKQLREAVEKNSEKINIYKCGDFWGFFGKI